MSSMVGEWTKRVRAVGSGPERLMSVFDAVTLATTRKNVTSCWCDLRHTHPNLASRVSLHKFPGQGQRLTPVAPAGLMEVIIRTVLSNSRRSLEEKRHALVTCGYSTAPEFDVQRQFAETEIVSDLSKAFTSLDPIKQFIVGQYRIDLYLRRVKIAIECDEHGHRSRNYSAEAEAGRESFIVSRTGCQFVRFDPYAAEFCTMKLIGSIVALSHRQPAAPQGPDPG